MNIGGLASGREAPRCALGAAVRSDHFRPQTLRFGPAGALFFYFRPPYAFPTLDGRFIPLGGSTDGPLATPTQRTQNPPHMPRMKLKTCLPLNEIGDPPGGPQAGAIAQRLGPFLKTAAQFLQLGGLQSWFAASAASFLERLGSLRFPGLMPPADRLPVNVELARYLGLAQAPVEEFGGLETTFFKLLKVAFDAFRITHAQRLAQESIGVTILCDFQ